MSLERYLCVKVKFWRKQHFNSKKAFIAAFTILSMIILKEMPLLYKIKIDPTINISVNIQCWTDNYYIIWRHVIKH
jgi:hypothetical protein